MIDPQCLAINEMPPAINNAPNTREGLSACTACGANRSDPPPMT
jgi:hypothetical protein